MPEEKKEDQEKNKEEKVEKEEQKEEKQPEEQKQPEGQTKKEEEKKESEKEEEKTIESSGEGKAEEKEGAKEVEVPEKFKEIVKQIEEMKVADLAELVKILEKKFGVSSTPQVVAATPGGGGVAAGGASEEKSVFNIELTEVGAKKIEVIKVVRDVTGKGLKESKDLVDAAEKEPQMIKENVKKEEAEEIKKKFEAAGAKVELK